MRKSLRGKSVIEKDSKSQAYLSTWPFTAHMEKTHTAQLSKALTSPKRLFVKQIPAETNLRKTHGPGQSRK